ncbi:MAG: DUF5723 family protein [Prolixibacteraceae bacterium]
MKRKRQFKLLLLALGVILSGASHAQESGAFFMLPAVSQSSFLNPAIQNKNEKLVIGIPVLSGTQFSWNMNFPIDALFSNGLWNYSFHNFYNTLPAAGKGQASARISMFYGSLNYNEFTFSVSLSERAFGTTTFDREVVRLIRDGVKPYYGKDEYFGTGSFNFTHYRELAFGISQRYWKQLDIGIRPKVLFGRTYFAAQNVEFSTETVTVYDEIQKKEKEILHLNPKGTFSLAAPLTYKRDSADDFIIFSNDAVPGDYSFNLRNLGLAVDVGAVFRPNEFLEFSASLLDFGFTGFKHNTFDVTFIEPAEYEEPHLYQSHDPEGDGYVEAREALKAFTDSVSYIIDVKDQPVRILDLLPFKINLSAKYYLSGTLAAGFNNHFSYYGKHSANLLSGFVQKDYNRVGIDGSLSLYNISDVWLGLSASYTAQNVQYFIATKNISGLIQQESAKHINLLFGINLLFRTVRN